MGNKLCYLITDGGSYGGYTINAMGITDATRLYWHCQKNLLTRNSDYWDLAFSLAQATRDLDQYFNENDYVNVREATRAVGILQDAPVTIYNADGTIGMRFLPRAGDLAIRYGRVVPYATTYQLTEEAGTAEWIVRNGPDATDVVARYDSGDGNLYIKGALLTNVASNQASGYRELCIEFESSSTNGPRIIFDTSGNLKISGRVYDEDHF